MIIKLDLQKIRADDGILILIFVMYVVLLLFFKLIALMSIFVFPFSSLLLYSIFKLGIGLIKKNVWFILLGILGIPFSMFFLWTFFIQPSVTIDYIIYFLGMLTLVVGFAGVIKGILIKAYVIKLRRMNILIGSITVIFTVFTFIFAEDLFLYNIIGLSIFLIINAIFRAAMYLSEYQLSLTHLKSIVIIKFLFEIIKEIPIIEEEDESLEYIDI